MKFIKELAIMWHGLLPSFSIFTVNINFIKSSKHFCYITKSIWTGLVWLFVSCTGQFFNREIVFTWRTTDRQTGYSDLVIWQTFSSKWKKWKLHMLFVTNDKPELSSKNYNSEKTVSITMGWALFQY